jgi:protein Tex
MTDATAFNPVPLISRELQISPSSASAVIALLSEGNTVPFIARYRKEKTGSLDEVQIRAIEERHQYLLDLEKRRETILTSIAEAGFLTDALKIAILSCETKSALEDLYLPYKPKRRTRATIAREKGLEPLALRILEQPEAGDPALEAAAFVHPERDVPTVDDALHGARDIVAEIVSEQAEIRSDVRTHLAREGLLQSVAVKTRTDETGKFDDYVDYSEPIATIPSHRFLAVRRGEKEGFLRTTVHLDTEPLILRSLARLSHRPSSPFGPHLDTAVRDAFSRLLIPSVESDVRIDMKMNADRAAVEVFATNLRNLLLAPPLGSRAVIGIDPGLRTGCKCAVVDANGNFKSHMVFNIVQGEAAMAAYSREFAAFVQQHHPYAIAVGNGTGGRETEKFVRQVLKTGGITTLVVSVSEAGASVYSASEEAGREFPQLDLTIRGAISIARRLQDPLAELVKIDPKAIGVGQYQHDVHQPLLGRKLDEVVESCVNAVGVDLNTASASLLSRVSGVGPKTAQQIVAYRAEHGGFQERSELLNVKGLGPRAYEQSAGFLRIRGGRNPLDASAVHPERYALIATMAADLGVAAGTLVGNVANVHQIDIRRYVTDDVGEPTLHDIIAELKKPGLDPRDEFEAPAFREDLHDITDLQEGMILEGVVTNVAAFGAFVDVGVHRDGLIHISELSEQFVSDPHKVVSVGQKIRVRVLSVDRNRQRISFSARLDTPTAGAEDRSGARASREPGPKPSRPQRPPTTDRKPAPESGRFSYNPFAAALNRKRG